MLEGRVEGGALITDAFTVDGIGKPDGKVTVGIRPEHFTLEAACGNAFTFDATVSLREDLGGEEIVYFDVGGQTLTMMGWHREGEREPGLGEHITVRIDRKDIVCFDAATQIRL